MSLADYYSHFVFKSDEDEFVSSPPPRPPPDFDTYSCQNEDIVDSPQSKIPNVCDFCFEKV